LFSSELSKIITGEISNIKIVIINCFLDYSSFLIIYEKFKSDFSNFLIVIVQDQIFEPYFSMFNKVFVKINLSVEEYLVNILNIKIPDGISELIKTFSFDLEYLKKLETFREEIKENEVYFDDLLIYLELEIDFRILSNISNNKGIIHFFVCYFQKYLEDFSAFYEKIEGNQLLKRIFFNKLDLFSKNDPTDFFKTILKSISLRLTDSLIKIIVIKNILKNHQKIFTRTLINTLFSSSNIPTFIQDYSVDLDFDSIDELNINFLIQINEILSDPDTFHIFDFCSNIEDFNKFIELASPYCLKDGYYSVLLLLKTLFSKICDIIKLKNQFSLRIAKIKSNYKDLLEVDFKLTNNFKSLLKIIDNLKEIIFLNAKYENFPLNTAEDWIQFYINFIITCDNLISDIKYENKKIYSVKFLEDTINLMKKYGKITKHSFQELNQEFNTKLSVDIHEQQYFAIIILAFLEEYENRLNNQIKEYEEFYFTHFKDFIDDSNPNRPMLVMDICEKIKEFLDSNKRIILIIVDSLDINMGKILLDSLSQLNLEIVAEKYIFSMLPSETTISRRAIFGGATKSYITKNFSSPENEEDLIISALNLNKRRDVLYANDLNRFQENLKRKNIKINILVFRLLDKIQHNLEHGISYSDFKKVIKVFFSFLIDVLRNMIDFQDSDLRIIIGSDHGNIKTTNQDKKPNIRYYQKDYPTVRGIERDTPYYSLGSGRHQFIVINKKFKRFMKENHLEESQIISSCKTDIKNIFSGDNYFLLFSNDFEKYGIPQDPASIALVILRGKDSRFIYASEPFTHGGLTFYETIVPYYVLKIGKVIFKPLKITYLAIPKIIKDKENQISCKIINENNIDITDVELINTKFSVFHSISKIAKNSTSEFFFSIKAPKSGTAVVLNKLNYKILSKQYELTTSFEINVEPDIAEKIDESISRDIDKFLD